MGNVGIFYGHLEYITAIWYILWQFCKLVVKWYIFPHFGIFYQKIWQPWSTLFVILLKNKIFFILKS
jgi:hypothetical protein